MGNGLVVGNDFRHVQPWNLILRVYGRHAELRDGLSDALGLSTHDNAVAVPVFQPGGRRLAQSALVNIDRPGIVCGQIICNAG